MQGAVNWRDAWELASFIVTVVGLPFAIGVFLLQQRQERENEDEEAYQMLSDAYNDFLKIVLANADLQLRTSAALHEPDVGAERAHDGDLRHVDLAVRTGLPGGV